MIYRESYPSAHLDPFIDRYWSIESAATAGAPVEPVLPDGCPEIVFNLADRFQRIPKFGDLETQASAIVSGQLRRRILIRPTGHVELFAVRFRPHAAFGFLGVGMSSLTDQVLPLADVIGAASGEIESQIYQAGDFNKRIAMVEKILTAKLVNSNGDSSTAGSLTGMIASSGGRISVRELGHRSGIGERRIERVFDKYVGVSPKIFARIVRFNGVVRSMEAADSFGLLDTALSFGYYDQSHMIHEFNEFAGTNPSAFFNATHQFSGMLTS